MNHTNQMKKLIVVLSLFLLTTNTQAQLCVPAVQAYLSSITIDDDPQNEENLKIDITYKQQGDFVKDALQFYLIAYTEKNEKKIFETERNEERVNHIKYFDDPSIMRIIDTKVVLKTKTGNKYNYSVTLNKKEFVKDLIKNKTLKNDPESLGGKQMEFSQTVKFAVFIPLPTATHYANLPGLPRHREVCMLPEASNRQLAYVYMPLPHLISVQCRGPKGKGRTYGLYIKHQLHNLSE